jgi:hypothetical protein
MHDPGQIDAVGEGARPSLLPWIMVAITVALSVGAYLACIHMLGFPDGHVSPSQRVRRVVAYVLLGVNGAALGIYAGAIIGARRPRHWRRMLTVHAVLVVILVGVILHHSGATFDV